MLQPCTGSAQFSTEQDCAFGTIVRALWPNKTALNLAQRIGCSERGAQYLIDGKRKINARCVRVIVDLLVS